MIHYKERHTLQLKWLITFPRYIRKVGILSGSIYKYLYVSNCAISVEIDSQNAYRMLDLVYHLCKRNGMLCHDERHPLVMKWSITFLRCMVRARKASECIQQAPYCQYHAISVKVDSQIVCKMLDVEYPISA